MQIMLRISTESKNVKPLVNEWLGDGIVTITTSTGEVIEATLAYVKERGTE